MAWFRSIWFCALALVACAAQAQDYPVRPIRLIVPANPGGGTDYLARDPLRDLAPITQLAETPEFLVVSPQLQVNSLAELVKLLKANPGKYSMASGGSGTVMHLAGELMKLKAGLDVNHVPYKGEGPGLNDLLAGHVPMMLGTISSLTHVRAGKLRALAVTSAQRSPVAPEVPTFAEQGYPEINLTAWFAVLAPAGTPRPILDKLEAAITKIVRSKAVTDDLVSKGYTALGTGADKLAERMRSETALMAEIVKAAKLKPND
ncbi:MAG: tripartite tricarboxylate transporter substrate binding protein [Rubrivivax sp.]